MRTEEITSQQFKAQFGEDMARKGPFSYFKLGKYIGIVKNNHDRTIEFVLEDSFHEDDISALDEQLLLASICGKPEQDLYVPSFDSVFDYEARRRKSKNILLLIYSAVFIIPILILCLTLYLLIYYV
ncbi:hypothetical protein [Cytobacillus sp. IB215316]|uniref:hypothetical protein n=1 Tax=Cytobacillus sp. IB215316 TaxID=3097354 RepID=UPI002A101D5B|nr:hypothetical protein [Cytobacillus sp. IB215316]MDX8360778.1 hypothetical protein [Cytobacillus sp. IB215316]